TNYSAPETAAGDISGRCTDNAGNTSTYVHFLFKFDATGPSASLSASGLAGMNGWFIGNVTISAAGSDSVSDPTICTPDQHQTAETTGTGFNGSCTNDAGLTTPAAQLTVKLDKTAPTGVTLTPSGTLGLNGWYVTDVTIHTSGSEDISNPIVCTGDQSQTTDTAGQLLHGSCTNDAGLVANATDITVKRDATPPALTGSRTPLPNSYGWNNVDVTVNFSCSDATSGVNAGPLTPQVVSTEGPGQS